MKNTYDVIIRPLVTEKSNILKEKGNQISFEVNPKSNKIEIKRAVEEIFKVNVLEVRTMNFDGKRRRYGRYTGITSAWKKAVVKLKEGDKIEFFEGV
jgi:large subunit ribosomal protein L23